MQNEINAVEMNNAANAVVLHDTTNVAAAAAPSAAEVFVTNYKRIEQLIVGKRSINCGLSL